MTAPRRSRWQDRSVGRERIVACVLRHFVARNVEAGGVRQVVDVEGVLEAVPLLEADDLHQRCVCALLESLAEDVALAVGEDRFRMDRCWEWRRSDRLPEGAAE